MTQMTRTAFIDKYKFHLLGMAIYGRASDAKDGPLKKAMMWYEAPAEVERLLSDMFDDLQPKVGKTNGHNYSQGSGAVSVRSVPKDG